MRAALLTLLFSGITAQAAPALDCKPQSQLDVSIIKPRILFVGEAHGTEQAPAFVSGLVCSLLKDGRSVVLALEMEFAEQAALNAYVDSAGSAADRQVLLGQGGWTWNKDGRTSQAMLALIDDIRLLRRAGHRVGVMTLQAATPGIKVPQGQDELLPYSPDENMLSNRINDRMMADRLASAAMYYAKYTIVALAGYAHSSTRSVIRDPGHAPAGQLLAAMAPVYFIGLKSSVGGEAWQQRGSGAKAYAIAPGPMFIRDARIEAEVELGKLSASPPANSNNQE